jgi:ABC-2 type transport system ATP-binding protein
VTSLPPPPGPVVAVTALDKRYQVSVKDPGLMGAVRHLVRRKTKDVHAVKGVSFTLQRGEIVGFLGPNGAGKTTTLKMLTGLVHPTAGTVTVAGHVPFARHGDFLRKITLVMGGKQQLLWDLPAADTLRINAAVYELDADVVKRRTGELAEMLELKDKLHQPVRKLSLGERMKAELLAALLHAPEVLFLDEPTLGLDVNAQAATRKFLQEYNARYGATVLLTSHYMADITALCQRVLVIHEGALVYDGALEALLHRFAPMREVKVELEAERTREELAKLGEVASLDGRVARFSVPRGELTGAVSRMLQELPVVDLTVGDPPVEEVIGRLFKEGVGADPSGTGTGTGTGTGDAA